MPVRCLEKNLLMLQSMQDISRQTDIDFHFRNYSHCTIKKTGQVCVPAFGFRHIFNFSEKAELFEVSFSFFVLIFYVLNVFEDSLFLVAVFFPVQKKRRLD